jgi:ATP-dependent RNA helicase RhlE
MKFEEYRIAPEIKRSLEEQGFKRPTDIQFKAIPSILKGEDVLAIAQTGTGKTAAFAIPVLHLLHQRKEFGKAHGIQCLVMVPTRELAQQITGEFQKIAKYLRMNIIGVFGGVEQDPQIAKLEKGIDVLIATPGRLFDLVSQGHIKLEQIQVLILDEADHMLDLGFIKDIRQLIHHLPKRRQTLFFSATIDTKIKELAYSLVNKPVRIQISPKDPVAKNVDHFVAHVEMDDKRFFLERVIKENEESKILVFVRTKVRAERVKNAMERVFINCETIHGDKDQAHRSDVMAKFRSGELKVLITTDVSARGIDIPEVEYVVNYDLPDKVENYVHRVGRTGRATHRGHAVSFVSTEEREILAEIEDYLGNSIKVLKIDKMDYEATIDFSDANPNDWQSLMKEGATTSAKKRKKK